MSYSPPEELNPFDPPRAGIGSKFSGFGMEESDAELIRRAHIGHEASIKSLGWLNYFGAFLCLLFAIFLFIGVAGAGNIPNIPNGFTPESFRVLLGVGVAVLLGITVLYGALGYGLTHLKPWARWTTIVLLGLNFAVSICQVIWIGATAGAEAAGGATVGALLGSLIPAYIFYLVASAKGGVVFSADYKQIIAKTPHVKYKTSIIVKIFLVILLLVLVLAVVGGIMSAFRR